TSVGTIRRRTIWRRRAGRTRDQDTRKTRSQPRAHADVMRREPPKLNFLQLAFQRDSRTAARKLRSTIFPRARSRQTKLAPVPVAPSLRQRGAAGGLPLRMTSVADPRSPSDSLREEPDSARQMRW